MKMSNNVIFMILITFVMVTWIYVFRLYINGIIEQRTFDNMKIYADKTKMKDSIFLKKDLPLVFYESTEFTAALHPSIVIDVHDNSHDENKINIQKSRPGSWEFEYEYSTITKKPADFIYNETGELWEDRMGLDFGKNSWFDDMVNIRDRLYANKTKDINKELHKFWLESNGFSRFIYTKNYAFVSNVCIHVRNGQVSLHLKTNNLVDSLLTEMKWKDFYFNPYKIVKNSIPEKQLPLEPLDLIVAHPRSTSNAYQFLEGTSYLAYIALHPEIFPKYRQLLIVASQRQQNPDSWNQFALRSLLNIFPDDNRPVILRPYADPRFNGHNLICDRIMTFIRNWEPIGSGSFIGSILSSDFFRASSYLYNNFYPDMRYSQKLQLTVVRRPVFRLIQNHDKFIQRINKLLLDYYEYSDIILEELTIEQRVIQMTKTDVLFGVHGTGLVNMLFMTKNSFLIEAYPPFWFWSCYQRFAKAIGIKSVVFKSKGEKGPECKDDEDKSTLCQQKGIRDRNFTISISDGIKYLWEARLYVIENKYNRDPRTIA